MRLRELFEDRKKKVVAVMPGGFHPFHPGHKSLYDWAVKTFGQDNVYVAATDDTKSRPFPFNIKQQLASMAGVPKERFIQVKSPFNALSYQSLLNDAENTALVFVRSDKDQASHPKPDQIRKSDGQMGYIISYDGNLEHGADMHGYMTYGPTQDFNFSGLAIRSASELRAAWPEMGDEDKLQAANLMYPGNGEEASKMLDTALGIRDKEPEMAEGWFSGDILPAPKWLNDENNTLWQKIQPTTKDKRLVKQLKKLQRFIKAGLTDQANQVVAKELSMMQREGIEESKKRKKRLDPKCWKGYRKDGTKMKGGTRVNNCVKVSEDEYTWEGDLHMLYDEDDLMEADYQGRNVKLGKPMQGDVKKFKVYVKNPKGNVVKVNFGHGGSSAKGKTMSIKKNNPGARKSFRARHNCDSPGPRHKARYWSCRKW
tara:strand:+ start:1 stop:1281 length:1281 start_codon:yes stop_codon:yes gene_type:complete